MKSSKTLRSALLATAAATTLLLGACSDTDISSPGAVASPPPPPPPPPPAGADADLVPDGFDDSSPNLATTTVTTAAGNNIEVVQISGTLEDDLTLENGVGYFVSESVFVGTDAGVTTTKSGGNGVSQKPDAALTVEAGATVYFEGSNAGLIVTRGSQIIADGTAANPIVFTSIAEYERQNGLATANESARAEWLGLVINGFAPINNCNVDSATPGTAGCEDDGEAASGLYGGGDASDNSGILDYVRVEHAGVFYTEEDQSNGIAFQGVGSGTRVSNIQVHNNGDDGVEFFGGTVSASNVVITGAADDSVDWTDGWTGSIQRLLVIQSDDAADYAIEADNRGTGDAADTLPRSNPTITNFTFIGNSEEDAIRLREGTAATLVNGIVSGFDEGLKFGDDETAALLTDGPSPVDGAETIIASHLFNNTTDVPTLVDNEGTDDDTTDDTTVAAATIRAALQNVTESAGEVAAPFSFVPGLETSEAPLRDSEGRQLFDVDADPDGIVFDTVGVAVGEEINTAQIGEVTSAVEDLNDDGDPNNDVTPPTYSEPKTVLQTAATNVFDITGLNDNRLTNFAYIGAFGPNETADDNWAANWTKPGTVFDEPTGEEASCPTGTTVGGQIGDNLVCALTGTIRTDVTLTAQNNVLYRFDGQVFVGDDGGPGATNDDASDDNATLTIEAGVTVFGNSPTDGLVISRGSQLVANGTADNPVVLTSGPAVRGQADYANDTAQWLGLSINGKAPINACNVSGAATGTDECEDDGEASSGLYGGGIADDSSGSIQYLRLEFSGIFFSEEDQSNGIAFQGVGSGTDVDFIQVHNNGDDGIEFFGGTVDVKNAVMTGANDDAVDWTDGWKGRIQYLIVEASEAGVDNDHGFEGDNRSESAPDTLPRSTPQIANYTIIGQGDNPGVRFREGMGGDFFNGIIVNVGDGIDIDDRSNELLLGTGDAPADGAALTINGLFLDAVTDVEDDDGNAATAEAAFQNYEDDVATTMGGFSFYGRTDLGVVPGSAEAIAPNTESTQLNDTDTFFDAAAYLGAVQDVNDTWYLGWTVDSSGEVTSAD